jgi:hypothetical protein
MLQVLWEWGWINVNRLSENKMMLQGNAGFIIKDYSLSILMGNCTDFANKKSQLEYVCQSLGVEALITTKYHAEYAGEGIEYSWGASKAVYRRYPLACKKGKANLTTSLRNASRGTYSRWIGSVSLADEHVVTCSPTLHYNSFTRTKVRSRS